MGYWIYVVWFLDTLAEPDDEDREWPAVLAIFSHSAETARQWGDHLARKRANRPRSQDVFLWSEVHLPNDPRYGDATGLSGVPLIAYGEEADDAQIGW